MSQMLSGSPEEDDQLPSFLQQHSAKLSALSSRARQQASAGPSSSNHSTPQRSDTLSPHSDDSHSHAHARSHSHGHARHHTHSRAHGHTNSPSQSQSQSPSQQQRQNTMRSQSTTSNTSLGVPPHERMPSRSMSRTPSHEYRETLDAKSKDLDDGSTVINQYKITDTIGRGAYGTVRKAVLVQDPDVAFAVKEFGKTRLRKTHRADKLRKPARGRGAPRPGNRSDPTKGGPNPKQDEEDELKDPLTHIRHEIAILKKLHHPHVVKLYEVLDDPTQDSLYMVFEYCPDGTIIDVKLNSQVEPLPEDVARLYFVQILMGIEYLHENEIVHRDIKPDNILLSDDRKTCKIVDFGVSEMFLKPGDDTMQKSAGSPAFMSPELCTAGHAEYHGKSDDVWSFGVTLYCMVVGHLPFDKDNFYEMYESIKNDQPEYPDHLSDDLKDLLQKMFIKDPEKRITVPQMRQHPWTLGVEEGILLSTEDNLEAMVSEITDEDLDCAICKITNIFTFARAISRFKKGGSMNRARREATRSTSGGSESNTRDRSWFPASTPGPDEREAGGDGDESMELASDAATIKEKTPQPESQQQGKEEVDQLQKAAANIFESPQMHTFELPTEESNSNGPLQRNRSGPISSLHKLDTAKHSPPAITMESPRSASPEMFDSPTSDSDLPFSDRATQSQESSTVYTSQSTRSNDEAVTSHLSGMNLDRKETYKPDQSDKQESKPRRAKTLQERAASLGKKESKPKPKLLPDQPTFQSPRHERIETPPGAAEVYVTCKGEKGGEAEGENPYFQGAKGGQEKRMDEEEEEEAEEVSEAERQAQTV